ncbi:MAG TPA: DUF11 domain-containing protein [Acidimicrobiia bacterium]|nr:DUF11 domain-containing protein [Acidimicrobiia bacterium]
MFTSTFWKRAALGAGLVAIVVAGAPQAMAAGRFELPYGLGLTGPVGPAPVGALPPGYSPPPSGRFGPPYGDPGYGYPGSGGDAARPSADLGVTMTSTPNPAVQGGQFEYDLTVTNAGPAPTTDISLSDQLPTGARFIQATASQGACSVAQQYVRCALDQLDGGRSATVTITVDAVQADTLYNTASVMGQAYDPYEGNNTAMTTTDVQSGQSAADISVANSVDKATAASGDNLTYTITVANAGPSVALGSHLSDQLPDGAQFLSASASQGSCAGSATDVACELGDLASGGSATVTVVARAVNAGPATNTAYVTSRMYDANTGDNQSAVTTDVQPAAGGGSAPAPQPAPRPGPGVPGPPQPV